MKKIVLFDPSISTLNIGDQIIFNSIAHELAPILKGEFVVRVSTHLPISDIYANLLSDANEKYVCGTNLLRNNLQGRFRQWDINLKNAKTLAPCVLMGVGWHNDNQKLTKYTKRLYQTILDKERLHSVRDEFTKIQLQKLGFNNVVNTGCATMWQLTPTHCATIPTCKSDEVIFTLTDYHRDMIKDKWIIETLHQEYKKVYLWLQGYDDFAYAKQLDILDKVQIIEPSLEAYDKLLEKDNIEYIGTRLHGGIRALQRGKRTMIIAVDNRAIEKKKDFNLPVTERNALTEVELKNIIFQERKTNIHINEKEIYIWRKEMGLI